jgi:hypothetical protein
MTDVPVRLILVDPPAGVDFGVQRGRGAKYETLFVQQRSRRDISFDFSLAVSDSRKDGLPNFQGPFAQGPSANRFIYIDVGTYAGQQATPWSRRMKVPLARITWELIRKTNGKPGYRLSAKIPGTGNDGGPSCATVRLLGGWEIVKD